MTKIGVKLPPITKDELREVYLYGKSMINIYETHEMAATAFHDFVDSSVPLSVKRTYMVRQSILFETGTYIVFQQYRRENLIGKRFDYISVNMPCTAEMQFFLSTRLNEGGLLRAGPY